MNTDSSSSLGVGSWELGVGSWEFIGCWTLGIDVRGQVSAEPHPVMLPDLLVERRGTQAGAAGLLFGVAEDVRRPDLHRHVLAGGVLLQVDRQREAFDDGGSDDRGAVGLEQQR